MNQSGQVSIYNKNDEFDSSCRDHSSPVVCCRLSPTSHIDEPLMTSVGFPQMMSFIIPAEAVDYVDLWHLSPFSSRSGRRPPQGAASTAPELEV